ncbi:FHA domain-containing protein [Nonomuraea sp. ATR24]|uniref:FHA domain-containing protein n=1 Tax=Nonomuraea sp. ATR24 TaxID=1676744 RepID=UPI0035C0C8DF
MTDHGFGTVRPLPGDGLVAYLGGLLLVCDADEAAGTGLIEALRETAASGGDGRALARRAAQVLAANMAGDPATCAVAGPVGGGVAVLVSGSASATVTTASGETRLAGSDSLTWSDRLIAGPVERIELSLPGARDPHPAVGFSGGVVHGGGITAAPGDADEPGEPAGSRSGADERSERSERAERSRSLTSEMPNTALHMEPDLLPRAEPPAQAPPYPLSGPEPGPPSGPQFRPQPPSAPHHPGPQSQPQIQSQPQPPSQPHLAPPGAEHPGPPGPPPFPSYDEPAPAPGNGTVPEYEQAPPQQEHFESGPPLMGPPSLDPPPHLGPPPGDHPPHLGPPPEPFDQPQGPPPPFDPQGHPQGHPQPGHEQPDHGDRPLVYGVDCTNDHFNDPRAPYCAVCGIALVQRSLVPYKGPRPQLGVLVLDDGSALPLDSDYLLGRDPERAPEVAGGNARPAKVTSPDGSVSRRHLRVALDGWDVNLVDLGSVNGTQIQPPGDPNFYDIPPNEPVTIAPGTTVRVGVSRTLRFEAHRG